MARDKESDNEAKHSPRQKHAQALVQNRSGVMISEPTERHVTHQAKHVKAMTKAHFDHLTTKRTKAMHVEARTKARFNRPTTKRTEYMHVEARMKARFDCSTTPKTTKPTTTPPHPWAAPLTLSPARPPSLRVCDDALKVDLSRQEFDQVFSYDIKEFSTYVPTV